MSTYTAYNALAELEKRPSFKRGLVGLLELGRAMATAIKPTPLSDELALAELRRLGSMINLRSTIEQENGK